MIDKKMASKWLPVIAGAVLLLLMELPHSFSNDMEADINKDGRIDNSDMTVMGSEMGRDDCSATPCRADLNGDGRVNNDDVNILREALNASSPSAAGRGMPAEEFNVGPWEGLEEPSTDTGQGEEKQESPPATTKFRDNNDGTVTDTETGLMWTKNADLYGDTMLYHQALDYIEKMNRSEYPNSGYRDWRLPTLAELRSLVDYTKLDWRSNGLPDGHPFEHVKSLLNDRVYVSAACFSRFFSLYCRLVGHNVGSCFGYVWAVRG